MTRKKLKLDKIELRLSISSLDFLKVPHLIKYEGLFKKALRWLAANEEGSCSIDLRAGENLSKDMDLRFVSGAGRSMMILPGVPRYPLDNEVRGKKIYFAFATFNGSPQDRLSFDWRSDNAFVQNPTIQSVLKLGQQAKFQIEDRFYVRDRSI
jgi:hypothetical protein